MGNNEMTKVFKHKGELQKTPLHFTLCGLDDVYLANGYEIGDYYGEETLAIKDLEQLHRAIGDSLVREKKVLNGRELRFLRKEMDMTQSDLAHLLGLTGQQVARWEKGKSAISGPTDLLLRVAYLQSLGEQPNVSELRASIDDTDAPRSDKAIFEDTPKGWRHRYAA
jgi:DNA-binding transcriptional regulator YiaG